MKKIVNLTPHAIVLNTGEVFEPSGKVARVSSSFEDSGLDVNGIQIFETKFGQIIDLPDYEDGTFFIVSAMVMAANKGVRKDLIAPATSHPDTIRNEKGHIVSVPGFTI